MATKRDDRMNQVAGLLGLAFADPSYRPTIVDDAELANAFDRGMLIAGRPNQKAWRGTLAERAARQDCSAAIDSMLAPFAVRR